MVTMEKMPLSNHSQEVGRAERGAMRVTKLRFMLFGTNNMFLYFFDTM